MSLLPKSTKEFSEKEYWNEFFKKRGAKSFEWYGEYAELCGTLHKYVKQTDNILVAGCGNSTISGDLYKVGYRKITNVDISEIVIRQMKEKYNEDCPDMLWVQADITATPFEDSQFSCVLDKGTLDALMTDDSEDVVSFAQKYFTELGRILRVGGRLVCVSLLQQHILRAILDWFPSRCWLVRVIRCSEADSESEQGGEFSLPVFVVVCTQFRQMTNWNPVLELCMQEDGKVTRVPDANAMIEAVQEAQHYAMLKHKLSRKRVAGGTVSLQLCSPVDGQCRFLLHVADVVNIKSSKIPFGVFIVPQGREKEWLFGTPAGRENLAETAGASRLIVVHLQPGQTYDSITTVQDELSGKVLELAPPKLPSHFQVPFMSVGDDLGKVEERFRGKSEFSGEFVVEDVSSNESAIRRLIFLDNRTVVQSEAKLKKVQDKKKKRKKFVVDSCHMASAYQWSMLTGLNILTGEAKVLLVGLGGGPLANCIHAAMKKIQLSVVEIDAAIVNVARQWFGFTPDNRLSVHVEDGLSFIHETATRGEKYDAIIIDVDSKDSELGMSCPPKSFVERTFLDKVASCLTSSGTFILNLSCRDENLRAQVINDIRAVFPTVIRQSFPGDVNYVLFCCQPSSEGRSLQSELVATLNNITEKLQATLKLDSDIFDVQEAVKNLVLIS